MVVFRETAVVITDATARDVAAIVGLVESAYRGDASRAGWTTEADLLDGRRTDTDEVAQLIAARDSYVMVVRDAEDALFGCCHIKRKDDATAYFGMFAVSPTQQGGGIGGLLLTAAEARVRELWSSSRMEMTVLGQRADLISWYERRGYAATGHTFAWPHTSETFGIPRRDDLFFATLAKDL